MWAESGGEAGNGESSQPYRSGFAVIVGRPNVGKSTLMNALVGTKVSIVSPQPQTTRLRVTGVMHRPDGQVVFLDTPGIQRPRRHLDQYMEHAAEGSLAGVEAVLWVVEAGVQPGPRDRLVAALLAGVRDTPILLILNKVDQAPRERLPELERAYVALLPEASPSVSSRPVSALTGEGIAELRDAVFELMPPGPRYFLPDMVTDQPERILFAELVREAALHLLRQEVPHALAVVVEQMEQRRDDLVYVAATIYVEHESQKGIVIGHGGGTLKNIGSLARQQMESLFESRFYLDLNVKVRAGWRDSPAALRQMGYALDRGETDGDVGRTR